MAEGQSAGDLEEKAGNHRGFGDKPSSPGKSAEDGSAAGNGGGGDLGMSGVSVKTAGLETLAIPIPLAASSGFVGEGGHALIDCRSFSQLLAGAMASPVGNSRTSPVLTLPMEGMRLPLVAVPCIIAPAALLESPGFAGQFAMTHQAVLATVTAHAQMQLQTAYSSPSLISTSSPVPLQQALPTASQENCVSVERSTEEKKLPLDEITPSKTPSTDGFNWRKYGQKQVKGGENSRSYYKCTFANCSAKKKIERCYGGHVVEIIYRGDHSHDPPPKLKSQREKEGQPLLALMDSNGFVEVASKMSPRRPQKIKLLKDRKPSSDVSSGDNDVVMTASTEDLKESETSPSCPSASERQVETDACIKIEEGNANEPTPKKRIKEGSFSNPGPSPKIVKEQRVIVQRTLDGGVVSDGYRWRKYGQKFVKGNSNPRSYYRCTHIGCPVRKHMEKDSKDPMALIITYEGEHNHNRPPPKNDGETPVLLIAAAAAAAAAASSPSPVTKVEPPSDVEHGGDRTLESAETLLSMGLSPTDNDDNMGPVEELASTASAEDVEGVQQPTFEENPAPVPIQTS